MGRYCMKLKAFKNRFLVIGTFISTTIYLIWRIFFTIPFGYGIVSIIAALALLIVEILGMFEAAIHYYNMSNIEYPKRTEVDESLFQEVDVFIATYNEPVELLYKTINGCNNMDYPDKSKVHIYLCDDGNRPEMAKLAKSLGINYLSRNERKYAKAGNLNNAMAHSTSPLIVTFDADMIPMHDFLTACVPYFLSEEKIGFIQTPQSFYNPDLFQYNLFSEGRIPNEQNYFYRDVQISRNKSNSVIYGGTNTIILREALESAGGFYTKAITEDFATGLYIQSKGYKCYAINEVHASGLSPSDLKSLVKQRDRWARGCIQTGRKLNILFKKGLKLEQKLSYISAIYYWYSGIKRLIYIMSPILFAVFGVVVVKCTFIQVILFWLPMYLFSNSTLKNLSRGIRSTKWTNIYETVLFPSLIIPVILETFGITKSKFAVTKKERVDDDKKYRFKKAIPHMFFAVLSVIGIINCIRWTFYSNSIFYTVVLFWLVVNFYNILMSLFFMLGRKMYRKVERFPAVMDCVISYDHNRFQCKTIDISENGIAVFMDFPEYITYDKTVEVNLNTERYSTKFQGEIVQVSEMGKGWKYTLKVVKIEEKDFKQLLNITYDREPSLPKNLDKNSSIYDDLRVNVLNRNKKLHLFTRKLPRIILKKKLESIECEQVTMSNFNYEYIAIQTKYIYRDTREITIPLSEDIVLHCVLEKALDYDSRKYKKKKFSIPKLSIQLYKVTNYRELIANYNFKHILMQWIREAEQEDINKNNPKAKEIYASDEINEMLYLH